MGNIRDWLIECRRTFNIGINGKLLPKRCKIKYDSQLEQQVSGLMSKLLQHINHQLATVSWQQPSVGNGKKMNKGQPHPCAFLKCENSFHCPQVWIAASLFLSTFFAFKKSHVWMTRSVLSIRHLVHLTDFLLYWNNYSRKKVYNTGHRFFRKSKVGSFLDKLFPTCSAIF